MPTIQQHQTKQHNNKEATTLIVNVKKKLKLPSTTADLELCCQIQRKSNVSV